MVSEDIWHTPMTSGRVAEDTKEALKLYCKYYQWNEEGTHLYTIYFADEKLKQLYNPALPIYETYEAAWKERGGER